MVAPERVVRAGPLVGLVPWVDRGTLAGDCAAGLLADLGASVPGACGPEDGAAAVQAAGDWARSGLVPRCGRPGEPPRVGPGAIPSCAGGALLALGALAPGTLPRSLDGAALLGERAARLGLGRRGRSSPNGSCHLLAAADGELALNLARDEDWALLPALLEAPGPLDRLEDVARLVGERRVDELLERGRLLGLPLAAADGRHRRPGPWCRVAARGVPRRRAAGELPRVVDLSSLWAGPLCSHLLQLLGARVVKVESTRRPDGARRGDPGFFALLNGGKESVALDFASPEGRRRLRALLGWADIVIEGSRPRGLLQLGIDARERLEQRPGLTWVSITGYGREQPRGEWVAFGDDAAVAAGVAAATADPPLFCGDALADPLAGLHAALAAWAHWRGGGGVLLDLSLVDVTAHCLDFRPGLARARVVGGVGGRALLAGGRRFPLREPRPRSPSAPLHSLGADTERVLRACPPPC